MKKWWITLAVLVMLLIPSVAMAGLAKCPTCNVQRNFEPTGKYANRDLGGHQRIQKCKECGTEIPLGAYEPHTETREATCTSQAYCAVCQGYYGLTNPNNHIESRNVVYETKDFYEHYKKEVCAGCKKVLSEVACSHNPKEAATCVSAAICEDCGYYLGLDMSNHNWSEWKPDETAPIMHYRICQNSGCSQSERERHDGNANCVTSATCSKCLTNYKDTDTHIGPNTITCGRISDTEHQWTITYKACGHTVDGESEAHTETTPATCTTAAYCDVCKSNYGSTNPNAHNLVQHKAKAPTCTEIGWDAYETCSRCDYSTYVEKSALGHDYAAKTTKPTCTEKGYTTHTCTRCQDSYRDGFVSALGHWYGEWAPNADGTHSATCRRGCGYRKTVPCTLLTCQLQSDAPDTAFTLCPVCGEVSDGTRLVLAEAAAKSVTGKLPAGEVVVRIGALAGGEQLMSVAFERSGELTRPTGQVKITLPAELLAGYTLSLLSEDGTETELALEADEKAETVSFVLDFTDSEIPVQVIRLVPEV